MASPDLALAPIPRALVLNDLAEAAHQYWEAGFHGRACLADGLTVAARDWTSALGDLARVGHPRVRALAQSRCEQIDLALITFYADEVA